MAAAAGMCWPDPPSGQQIAVGELDRRTPSFGRTTAKVRERLGDRHRCRPRAKGWTGRQPQPSQLVQQRRPGTVAVPAAEIGAVQASGAARDHQRPDDHRGTGRPYDQMWLVGPDEVVGNHPIDLDRVGGDQGQIGDGVLRLRPMVRDVHMNSCAVREHGPQRLAAGQQTGAPATIGVFARLLIHQPQAAEAAGGEQLGHRLAERAGSDEADGSVSQGVGRSQGTAALAEQPRLVQDSQRMVDVVDPETGLPSRLPQLPYVMSSVEGFEHAAQPRLAEDQRRVVVEPDLKLAVLALQDRQTRPEFGESKLANGRRSRSHGLYSAAGAGLPAVVHRCSCCPFADRVVTGRKRRLGSGPEDRSREGAPGQRAGGAGLC